MTGLLLLGNRLKQCSLNNGLVVQRRTPQKPFCSNHWVLNGLVVAKKIENWFAINNLVRIKKLIALLRVVAPIISASAIFKHCATFACWLFIPLDCYLIRRYSRTDAGDNCSTWGVCPDTAYKTQNRRVSHFDEFCRHAVDLSESFGAFLCCAHTRCYPNEWAWYTWLFLSDKLPSVDTIETLSNKFCSWPDNGYEEYWIKWKFIFCSYEPSANLRCFSSMIKTSSHPLQQIVALKIVQCHSHFDKVFRFPSISFVKYSIEKCLPLIALESYLVKL